MTAEDTQNDPAVAPECDIPCYISEHRNVCYEVRKGLKLTQEEFASALNVTRQTIIRWETNPASVPDSALARIVTLSMRDAL